jgi:hypothetical protein
MKLSTEAIVAIVTLIVGLPPTLLLFWNCHRRKRLATNSAVEEEQIALSSGNNFLRISLHILLI